MEIVYPTKPVLYTDDELDDTVMTSEVVTDPCGIRSMKYTRTTKKEINDTKLNGYENALKDVKQNMRKNLNLAQKTMRREWCNTNLILNDKSCGDIDIRGTLNANIVRTTISNTPEHKFLKLCGKSHRGVISNIVGKEHYIESCITGVFEYCDIDFFAISYIKFKKVTFKNCNFTVHFLDGVEFINCKFINCNFVFESRWSKFNKCTFNMCDVKFLSVASTTLTATCKYYNTIVEVQRIHRGGFWMDGSRRYDNSYYDMDGKLI